ncbi:MAG: hypothetical protein HC915_04730 [Anaerolineae bacterium]|nr:hypothetical protein [Anaerolineae bacterium]
MRRKLLIWGDTPLAAWLAVALAPQHDLTWRVAPSTVQDYVRMGGVVTERGTVPVQLVTHFGQVPPPEWLILATPGWGGSWGAHGNSAAPWFRECAPVDHRSAKWDRAAGAPP